MANTANQPKMSDEAAHKGSARTWGEWKTLLDDWGGAGKPHKEIAAYVPNDLGVDGWWAQGVTIGYEQLIGRRAAGMQSDGTFAASVSKTVPTSLADHFAAWVDDAEYIGIIALWFTDKGAGKSSVNVQIEKLADKDAVEERKATWKVRLADPAAYLKEI